MKRKILLICCFAFAALSLWADVFHPDSSRWVTIELHDRDTVKLDSAALYRFSQSADTVRNVLIECKSPRSTDTIFSSIDITGINVKDFKLTTDARCNVHLQGDAVFSGTSTIVPAGVTTIDVDTLPDVGSDWREVLREVLYIERGKINEIKRGLVSIGKNKSGDIHIHNITFTSQRVYLYDGIVSSGYANGSARLIMYGGNLERMYWTATNGTRDDTILVVNGGEVASIVKNGPQVAVINGGTVGFLEIYKQGNVYLNGGEIRTTLGSGSVQWWDPNKGETGPVDTLFFDKHAIVGYGHNRLVLRNKDGRLKLDDILSLNTIASFGSPLILVYENRAFGERILRVEPTAVNGDEIYNMTRADSLLDWDLLSIYESKKCTIHYQVADGIAPQDSTYQEGIVRYITSIPTRTNYDFMGWYADSNYSVRVDSLDEWSRGDTTLWALWEPMSGYLTYETFGIKLDNQVDLHTHYSEQQQFAIPDAIPAKPFYMFHGWHADSINGSIVTHTADFPLTDLANHVLYGDFTREIPSLSIMIAQGNCLVVRNPEGYSELETAYYTWVYQDTIVVNGADSIISDTLPSHKMYIEVGTPIPVGRYTSIIHIDEEWPIYVTRYFPKEDTPSSCPQNSNTQTLFYLGSYILEVDDKGRKYIILQ